MFGLSNWLPSSDLSSSLVASVRVVPQGQAYGAFDAVVFVERRRTSRQQHEQFRVMRPTGAPPFHAIRFASTVLGPIRQPLDRLVQELREVATYVSEMHIRSLRIVALEYAARAQGLEFDHMIGLFRAAFENLTDVEITIERPAA